MAEEFSIEYREVSDGVEAAWEPLTGMVYDNLRDIKEVLDLNMSEDIAGVEAGTGLKFEYRVMDRDGEVRQFSFVNEYGVPLTFKPGGVDSVDSVGGTGGVDSAEKYLRSIEQNVAWLAGEQRTANLIALWGSGALSVKQRMYVMGRIRNDLMVPEEMG